LARTCERYFMPYITRYKRVDNHTRVLEIGCGEDCACIDELMSIKETRTPIELFERLTREAGTLRITDRAIWLINPHYETKFGLRPRLLPLWMSRIPYVRNFFTTSCFYILTKTE